MCKRIFLILVALTLWISGVTAQNRGSIQPFNTSQSTTNVVNSFSIGTSCGATISSMTVTITALPVAGTTTYTFKLTNLISGAVQIIIRPVNSFALSNYPGIAFATPYNVEVSVNAGLTYGLPCLLYTPSPICTIGAQCSTTLDSMTQYVYCTYITGITGYRFRITNTVTNAVQLFDAPLNRFYFNQLTNKSFGTNYLVEVALKNTDGSYLPFNIGCTINTPGFPTTSIQDSQCKATVSSYKQNIYANFVSGATDYRFRISRAGFPTYNSTIARPLSYFALSMFSGLSYGTTYSVQVAVKIGGEWGPYGNSCYVTTSGSARMNEANAEFKVIAYPNPFAGNFNLDVTLTDESAIQIRVYDMLGKQVESRTIEAAEIENLQMGENYRSGVYNVIVTQGENIQSLRVIKR